MQQMERSVHKKFYKDNNTFKIYLIDCRLLALLSDSRPKDMLLDDKAFTEFKDANTENFFLQQLVDIRDVPTYYYRRASQLLGLNSLPSMTAKYSLAGLRQRKTSRPDRCARSLPTNFLTCHSMPSGSVCSHTSISSGWKTCPCLVSRDAFGPYNLSVFIV